VAGSLDGRARRVRRLETRARERGRPPTSSRTQEEAWAIDAEIARLEREMLAEGIDPYRESAEVQEFMESLEGLSLDEKIAALEAEIAREELEGCPED
jgi:hypothetical protein